MIVRGRMLSYDYGSRMRGSGRDQRYEFVDEFVSGWAKIFVDVQQLYTQQTHNVKRIKGIDMIRLYLQRKCADQSKITEITHLLDELPGLWANVLWTAPSAREENAVQQLRLRFTFMR